MRKENKAIVAMAKCDSLRDDSNPITEAASEAHMLGFGDPVAIFSSETGLGMTVLYDYGFEDLYSKP